MVADDTWCNTTILITPPKSRSIYMMPMDASTCGIWTIRARAQWNMMMENKWTHFLDVSNQPVMNLAKSDVHPLSTSNLKNLLLTADPYTPIQLDTRYGMPTNTLLSTAGGLPRNRIGQPNVLGMSALTEEFTPSFFTGDVARRAIERLQQQSDPWFVTASFHSPVSKGSV
jgi:hypothetical protein